MHTDVKCAELRHRKHAVTRPCCMRVPSCPDICCEITAISCKVSSHSVGWVSLRNEFFGYMRLPQSLVAFG